MEDIKNRIKLVMSTVFEIPFETINERSSTDNIEEWDSLRHMNLILALEEEFGISIPDKDVGDMVNYQLIELIVNEQQ
jgi:acyl carrier protein